MVLREAEDILGFRPWHYQHAILVADRQVAGRNAEPAASDALAGFSRLDLNGWLGLAQRATTARSSAASSSTSRIAPSATRVSTPRAVA